MSLLIASEVAAILRVEESTLYYWRKQTRDGGVQVGPRSFRVQGRVVWDSDDLDEYIRAQRDAATVDEPRRAS
jgi:hypothetical protein